MGDNLASQNIDPSPQNLTELGDTRAIAITGQLDRYDGLMFLKDQPVFIDPSRVPVNTPVRYESSQGLITTPTPIPLQPNHLYNPTRPVV